MCDGNCLECVFDDCIATDSEIKVLEKVNQTISPKDEEKINRRRAYSRQYYLTHKEQIKATRKIWYEKKGDYIRKINNERYKEYYKENREEILRKKKKAREIRNGRETNVCKDHN